MSDIIDSGTIGGQIAQSFLDAVSEKLGSVIESKVRGVMSGIMGEEAADLAGNFVSAGKEAKKSANDAKDSLVEAIDYFEDLAEKNGINVKVVADTKDFVEKLRSLPGRIKKEGLGGIVAGLDLDTSKFTEGIEASKDALEPLMNYRSVFEGLIAPKAINSIRKFRDGVKSIEGTLMEVDRAAAAVNLGFINKTDVEVANNQSAAYDNVGDAIREYRSELENFVGVTGKSTKEFAEFSAQAKEADLSFRQVADGLQDGIGAIGSSGSRIKGFAAALALAKGVGVDTTTVFQDLALFTKSLGLSIKEATDRYGLFAEVSAGTLASQKEVRTAILDSAKALRFFGDTSKGTARLYKNFLSALGTGQEGIAGELLSKFTAALEGMDLGMKAFLGTAGGIGGGGQGALGGSMDVEQAIMEGRFGEIKDAIVAQVEKFSGGPLMTFQEAMDSGQREQYVLQREVLKQLGIGVRTDQEANKMTEALVKGQEIEVKLDEKRGVQAVVAAGEEQLVTEVGPMEKMANMAEVSAQLGLTENISDNLRTSSERFLASSETMIDVIREFKAGFKNIGIRAEKRKDVLNVGSGAELGQVAGVELKTATESGQMKGEALETSRESGQTKGQSLEAAIETGRKHGLIDDVADNFDRETLDKTSRSTLRPEAIIDTSPSKEAAPSAPESVRDRIDANVPAEKEFVPVNHGEVKAGKEAEAAKPDASQTSKPIDDLVSASNDQYNNTIKAFKEAINELVPRLSVQQAQGDSGNVEVKIYIGDKELQELIRKEIRKDFKEKQAKTTGRN